MKVTQTFNHGIQAFLVVLQGINLTTVPAKFVPYVVGAISLIQWYVSNVASVSDPNTGNKLK